MTVRIASALRASVFYIPVVALPVAALIGAGAAQAGGFGLREQSTYYQGTSFAGNAAGGDGLASFYWNPAAISFYPGMQIEGNLSYIAPHASVDVYKATGPLGNNLGISGVGDIVDNAALPAAYMTYAWDNIAVGLAVNSPYGLITDAPCGWSGRFYGCYSRIYDVNVQGSIAWRVNEWLTLGGGLNFNYIDARLNQAQLVGVYPSNPPTPIYGLTQVDGDDIGLGFNVGALFTLAPGTTIGIGYRSFIDQNLAGRVAITNTTPIALANQAVAAQAALTLPDQVTASFRSQLSPNWTVMGTVEWTNWSTVQQLVVTTKSLPPSVLNLQWNDGWFFSAGAEYRFNPQWAVRAGIAYELTPVPDETRSPRLPDTNRLWLSAGATYNWTPQLSFDLAYTHIFGDSGPITQFNTEPANAQRGNLIGEVTNGYVDIISAAVRYKFNAPQTAAALFTK